MWYDPVDRVQSPENIGEIAVVSKRFIFSISFCLWMRYHGVKSCHVTCVSYQASEDGAIGPVKSGPIQSFCVYTHYLHLANYSEYLGMRNNVLDQITMDWNNFRHAGDPCISATFINWHCVRQTSDNSGKNAHDWNRLYDMVMTTTLKRPQQSLSHTASSVHIYFKTQ